MKRNIPVLQLIVFILLMVIVFRVSAQGDTCDPSTYGEINGLLAQAQAALENDNVTTAIAILDDISTLIALCAGGDTPALSPIAEPLSPVTHNADWTPVIREFDGVEMVLVPAGCFEMGSATGNEREMPVHQQCFDEPFWIDRYEVTNAQYHRTDEAWANDYLPRVHINWVDAWEFCKLRRMQLPTEAQWEYAARGPDGLTFPWGNEFVGDNFAHRGNSSQISEVDSYPDGVSWVGAFNMSGNVMEWTSTLHRPYPYDANDRRELLTEDGAPRVLRGGSFYEHEFYLRSAYRFGANTSNNNFNIGLRCSLAYSDTPSD